MVCRPSNPILRVLGPLEKCPNMAGCQTPGPFLGPSTDRSKRIRRQLTWGLVIYATKFPYVGLASRETHRKPQQMLQRHLLIRCPVRDFIKHMVSIVCCALSPKLRVGTWILCPKRSLGPTYLFKSPFEINFLCQDCSPEAKNLVLGPLRLGKR